MKKFLITNFFLTVLIVGLAHGLSFKYLFEGWETELGKKESALQALKKKNDANERLRQERQEYLRQVEIARQGYAELEPRLPSEALISKFFDEVKTSARSCHLTLVGLDTVRTQPLKPGLNDSPLRVITRGKSPDQLRLLGWFREYPRLVTFRSQEIKGNPETQDTTMTLVGSIPVDVPRPELSEAKEALIRQK